MGSVLLRRESISSTIRCRGWSPSFCGRRRGVAAQPPQVSVSPLTRRGGGFPIAPATPSGRLPCSLLVAQRWQVAAALSAAVTTTPNRKPRPTRMGANLQKSSQVYSQPLFGRRGLGERGFSQRSRLSPRISVFLSPRLFGREREGGGFSEEKPPPSQTLSPTQ